MSQLELPEVLVRKRVAFWVAKGVLKEVSANLYELQESAPEDIQSGRKHGKHWSTYVNMCQHGLNAVSTTVDEFAD